MRKLVICTTLIISVLHIALGIQPKVDRVQIRMNAIADEYLSFSIEDNRASGKGNSTYKVLLMDCKTEEVLRTIRTREYRFGETPLESFGELEFDTCYKLCVIKIIDKRDANCTDKPVIQRTRETPIASIPSPFNVSFDAAKELVFITGILEDRVQVCFIPVESTSTLPDINKETRETYIRQKKTADHDFTLPYKESIIYKLQCFEPEIIDNLVAVFTRNEVPEDMFSDDFRVRLGCRYFRKHYLDGATPPYYTLLGQFGREYTLDMSAGMILKPATKRLLIYTLIPILVTSVLVIIILIIVAKKQGWYNRIRASASRIPVIQLNEDGTEKVPTTQRTSLIKTLLHRPVAN